MKPVVIIAIAVGLSVVAVIGVLVAWQGIATMQAQEAFDEYQEQVQILENQEKKLEEFLEDVDEYYLELRPTVTRCVADENKSYLERQQCQIQGKKSIEKYIYTEFLATEVPSTNLNLDGLIREYDQYLMSDFWMVCKINELQCVEER